MATGNVFEWSLRVCQLRRAGAPLHIPVHTSALEGRRALRTSYSNSRDRRIRRVVVLADDDWRRCWAPHRVSWLPSLKADCAVVGPYRRECNKRPSRHHRGQKMVQVVAAGRRQWGCGRSVGSGGVATGLPRRGGGTSAIASWRQVGDGRVAAGRSGRGGGRLEMAGR